MSRSCYVNVLLPALLMSCVLMGCAVQPSPESSPEVGQSQISMSAHGATTAEQSATNQSVAPDSQSGAGQAQSSSSDNPLFFDTDEDKDSIGPQSGGDTSGEPGGGSQSATPPSNTRTDIAPPARPDTPQSLDGNAAADFAHYYVSVLTYSARTGDTAPLEAILHPECKECTVHPTRIRDLYSNQGRAEQITYAMKGELRATQSQSPDKSATFWFVHGQFAVSKYTITDLQSRHTYPATQTPTTLAICQHDNQWKICAIHQE